MPAYRTAPSPAQAIAQQLEDDARRTFHHLRSDANELTGRAARNRHIGVPVSGDHIARRRAEKAAEVSA